MKVLVSGAGIAGLSLALRLHQLGITPIVVERAPALRAVGYMLGLSDPGYDAAERLGIANDLGAAQYLPERLVYIGADGRRLLVLQGRALDTLIGERQLNLMRGDIERILYERIKDHADIHFGTSIVAFENGDSGTTATLDNSDVIDADLLVGADGLHSRVRALALGPEQEFVRFLGARVAAFILDRSLLPEVRADETYSLTEVGRAAGVAAVRGDRVMAFFMYLTERERSDQPAEAELRRAFARCDWRVPELLNHVRKAESIYLDEVALVESPRWSKARGAARRCRLCGIADRWKRRDAGHGRRRDPRRSTRCVAGHRHRTRAIRISRETLGRVRAKDRAAEYRAVHAEDAAAAVLARADASTGRIAAIRTHDQARPQPQRRAALGQAA
jgi:2-polyprenyl-6-methoxyphenol hydroxylase-like FAD-dependent oxidoreductase